MSAIILGAGAGSRMKSDLPKVLHKVAGFPLLAHTMKSAASAGAGKTVVVVGHGAEAVAKAALDIDETALTVTQTEQLGTAHAVAQASGVMAGASGDAVVLYADTPFVRPETIARMQAARAEGARVVVLGFEAANPGRYGRLICGPDGDLQRIVEAKDATAEDLAVTLCNSGVVLAELGDLFDLISRVGNDNASAEYYLTDIVGLARSDGDKATVVICDEAETMGVNSRTDLAAAEAAFQANARRDNLENGVTLSAPETVHFALDTVIGRDAIIAQNVVFGPGVTVESGAEIRAFCHLEGAHVSSGAIVGPFARLRPGAELGNDSHVGNFVEIKAASLGEGAKANHLSYIGDAVVGDGANIGAGTITCNYDGVFKHQTRIGAGAFIGSNAALVAPVNIGDGAMTAAGSTITSDVPDGALALARGDQVNRKGLAIRLMEKLRARKAALTNGLK